jgi:cellulose biosynthesis protein BcsQ
MSNDVLKALRESYGDMVFEKPIPMLQEARNSTERRSSLVSHKNSKVGQAYMAAVNEMIRRNAI